MAIDLIRGNIFNTKAQVVVNTVNCVGVMGKGIALVYKLRYPKMFDLYQEHENDHDIKSIEKFNRQLEYLKIASSYGHIEAMYKYTILLIDEEHYDRKEIIRENLLKLANLNHIGALFKLTEYYFLGDFNTWIQLINTVEN